MLTAKNIIEMVKNGYDIEFVDQFRPIYDVEGFCRFTYNLDKPVKLRCRIDSALSSVLIENHIALTSMDDKYGHNIYPIEKLVDRINNGDTRIIIKGLCSNG